MAVNTTAGIGAGFVTLDGELHARILDADRMPPFLMTMTGDADLWAFVTSRGGLTAGRVDPDGAIFPYETVDRLFDGHHHTGPVTWIRAETDGREVLWNPFPGPEVEDGAQRTLYKSALGHRIVFEATHRGLPITIRQRWSGADELGLVRTVTLLNRGDAPISLSVLDGLRNVLPHGAPLALHQQSSTLIDAYKRVDLDLDSGMAIYSLTSRIVDRAEAAEELRANVVWSHGLHGARVCLGDEGVAAFREGRPLDGSPVRTGRRGSYLLHGTVRLAPGEELRWHVVADVGLGHVELAALRKRVLVDPDLDETIETGLEAAGRSLLRIVSSADGLQLTDEPSSDTHHLANVLFNAMRGGVFTRNHEVPAEGFRRHLAVRNTVVAARHRELLDGLPAAVDVADLRAFIAAPGDPDLERLGLEYLPLYFGRRHGDPSRPWNRFRIRVRDRDGHPDLHYQGNWRDVFQNWEALARSFPGFLPGMIATFVNASTVDGFNPYRITSDGVEWEVVDPDDPWSYIGYWGDHQIIYLLKLLEAQRDRDPERLIELLDRDVFTYVEVPYRIASYADLLRDPRNTVSYDEELAARIDARVACLGADGKLVQDGENVRRANLVEKLLVPALSKLSNLVPGGGIWMNTQRPEWNDANNALVGAGLSVVTLAYLRRYLCFLQDLLGELPRSTVPIADEIVTWFRRVRAVLDATSPRVEGRSDHDRKAMMDALGEAFSEYRETVYAKGLSGREEVSVHDLVVFCRTALVHVDASVRANRREDGLYHAYNLLRLERDGQEAMVDRLYEMLEGQVAVLSSGLIDAAEAVSLLDELFRSRMYCPRRNSFLLYPERELPAFMDRNRVPADRVNGVGLLRSLVAAGDRSILRLDVSGVFRFHPDLGTRDDLERALDRLATEERWIGPVRRDRAAVLAVHEEVFGHASFTGRSGTMYGFEGLGCVYWHMVAKLLLAVQEVALRAIEVGEPAPIQEALISHYYRVRAGLGFEKTAEEFGAFPTDPYSHTPGHGGARQPGMTGQVKEEILTRLGELGVEVSGGRIAFRPRLLRLEELRERPGILRVHDVRGRLLEIEVPAGALAFTLCQVPVLYHRTSGNPSIRVTSAEGEVRTSSGDALVGDPVRDLLARNGRVRRIEVGIPASVFRSG